MGVEVEEWNVLPFHCSTSTLDFDFSSQLAQRLLMATELTQVGDILV